MAQGTLEREARPAVSPLKLDCLIELRPRDERTGIEFRDCIIDYTQCPNKHCIKKLQ